MLKPQPAISPSERTATTTATVPRIAFLNICVGGVGTKAGGYILERFRGDGESFAMLAFHLDTDPGTWLDTENRILLQLTASDVRAMRANPERFGPVVTAITTELSRLLRGSDILNGARTTRGLTQLSVEFFRDRLCRALRKALNRLRQRFKVAIIMPVILSSSGGGTGSASQILLMHLLQEPDFRHKLLGGIPSDLLLPPMGVVVEPFAYANEASDLQRAKIMSNALAFRLESEQMLEENAASYICHIGYANAGGTVLADPELMAKVLGYGVYEIERGWAALKARWVDDSDDIASTTNYGGHDIPTFDLLDGNRIQVRRKKP